MKKLKITQERLKEILSYDEATGVFTWLKRMGQRGKIGRNAGCTTSGYVVIRLDGMNFFAHRLAWIYVHGILDIDQIDHINGIKFDNRISNLRIASAAENRQNIFMAPNCNKSSGFPGVNIDKRSGKWQSRIGVGKRRIQVGTFNSKEEAYEAYLQAKKVIHPFSTLAKQHHQREANEVM